MSILILESSRKATTYNKSVWWLMSKTGRADAMNLDAKLNEILISILLNK